MSRNDAHSPANLVTEDYEYILSADNSPEFGPGWVMQYGDFGLETSRALGRTDRLGRGVWQCHHCGARIRYFAVLKHVPTGDYIAVGETCLENRFERATHEFQALRRQAQLDRQAQRIKTAIAEFVASNSDLAFMADKTGETTPEASKDNDFIKDVARKLRQYGELSERQIEAVRRAVVRDAERAARQEAQAEEATAPVPTGRVTITGTVVMRRFYENDFGGSIKIIVKGETDGGFWKVFVTEPAAITTEVGDVVTLTATIEASDKDESFGFGKRPSKASVLTPANPT